jgi:hypothetical protein
MRVFDCECSQTRPAVIPLGGPAADEDRLSLVFTPAEPCGVEIGPTVATRFPLRLLSVINTCFGDPTCPGEMSLLRASVQRLISLRGPGELKALHASSCEPNSDAKAPRVKLKVMSCGMAAPVWIDSDSEIVVPSGPAVIEIWGPDNWIAYGRTTVEVESIWEDVQLKIAVCPLSCYVPDGTLSTWLRFTNGSALVDRVLLVPRRARWLTVTLMNAANDAGVTGGSVWWDRDPSAGLGAVALGQMLFGTTNYRPHFLGAASHVSINDAGAGITLASYWRWRIQ